MADKNNEDTTINLDALSQGTADEVSEVNDVMGNSDGQTAQPVAGGDDLAPLGEDE